MVHVLGAEDPLDDGLIRAPVPDAEDRVAQEDGVPRQPAVVGVVSGPQHGELRGLLGGIERLHHRRPSPHFDVGKDRDDGRADQEDDGLDRLGDHHGHQTADDRVEPGQRGDGDDAHPLVDPEHAVQDHGAGGQGKADVNRDGGDHGEHGEPVPALRAVSLLEEVRQGGHPGPDVERREEEAEQHQGKGRHPLEVAHEQPRVEPGLGEADEVDTRDVGREQGQPDDGPAKRLSGEKIVAGAVLLLLPDADPATEPHDDGQIDDDYRYIDASHRRTDSTVCR